MYMQLSFFIFPLPQVSFFLSFFLSFYISDNIMYVLIAYKPLKQYLTLLSLHTITVLPLTTVYFVSKVHCTSNVLHSITP